MYGSLASVPRKQSNQILIRPYWSKHLGKSRCCWKSQAGCTLNVPLFEASSLFHIFYHFFIIPFTVYYLLYPSAWKTLLHYNFTASVGTLHQTKIVFIHFSPRCTVLTHITVIALHHSTYCHITHTHARYEIVPYIIQTLFYLTLVITASIRQCCAHCQLLSTCFNSVYSSCHLALLTTFNKDAVNVFFGSQISST